MPLVPQQKMITVSSGPGGGSADAIAALERELEVYPPVRIVHFDMTPVTNPLGRGAIGVTLTALVETV